MEVRGTPIGEFIDEVRARIAAEEYNFDKCATRANPTGPFHKEDVIAAMLQTMGSYGDMGMLLSRRRASVKGYVEGNWDVLEFYNELTETQLDQIKRKTTEMALAGDGPSARFLLKTLAKDRGFTTRTEMTGKDGEPLKVQSSQFDLANMSDEELAAYRTIAEHSRDQSSASGPDHSGTEQEEVQGKSG